MNQLASYSPSTIAWIPSLETFSMFVGVSSTPSATRMTFADLAQGPIFGKLYDNYGPRWILLGGSFFHVFGLMMTSISTEYYQIILAQGICSPLGASAVFYPSMSALSTWFHKNRALAFGVAVSGSSLGGVIFPIMVEHLVREVGFGWAMRISAFMILGMLIVANSLVKARIPPHPRPFELMEFINPLKEVPFALLTAAMFLFFFGMFLPFTFIILQAQRFGMSANLAGYLVPILNGARSVHGPNSHHRHTANTPQHLRSNPPGRPRRSHWPLQCRQRNGLLQRRHRPGPLAPRPQQCPHPRFRQPLWLQLWRFCVNGPCSHRPNF
jgi:MFS family permease